MSQKIKISADDEEIFLDTDHLVFTDATLNDYLIKAPSWFAYYNQMHAHAQYIASIQEDKYDQIYSEKFRNYKAAGGAANFSGVSCVDDGANKLFYVWSPIYINIPEAEIAGLILEFSWI